MKSYPIPLFMRVFIPGWYQEEREISINLADLVERTKDSNFTLIFDRNGSVYARGNDIQHFEMPRSHHIALQMKKLINEANTVLESDLEVPMGLWLFIDEANQIKESNEKQEDLKKAWEEHVIRTLFGEKPKP